jgi:outer membrane PBP1 activator LpoA protein
VVTTDVAWQRRTANAFAAEWRALGMTSQTMTLQIVDGFLNPDGLLAVRTRMQQDPPGFLFLALDAALASQLRLAIGTDVPMYGTSQLNPLTLEDWQLSGGLSDMEGMRFLDIPWQLQPDHAAVMTYPRADAGGQHRGAVLARLYALGIDAYRIARELGAGRTYFELDGVTGRLRVQFGSVTRFEREQQPAFYQEGKVAPVTDSW